MKQKKYILKLFLVVSLWTFWSMFQIPVMADSPTGNFQVFTNDGSTFVQGFNDLSSAINDSSTQNGYIIKMSADLDTEAVIVNKSIKLTSNGSYTLKRKSGALGNLLTINSGNTLTLEDIIIDGNNSILKTNTGSIVYINSGATFVLENGAILKNNKSTKGAGIYIDNSTFIMNGSTISNNITEDGGAGGGVYNNNGTFTMNGGTISNNITKKNPINSKGGYGGGICNSQGIFKMNGGTIDNNQAQHGAGVFSDGITTDKSEFVMNYGEIINNISLVLGGGVYNGLNSTFNLMDGSISQNTAGNGGGVYNIGVSNIYGGETNGNTSLWGTSEVATSMVVTFDTNGGAYSGNSQDLTQTVVQGTLVTKPIGVITKDGYGFEGWFTSTDGGITLSAYPWDFNINKVTAVTKLYAKWSKNFIVINSSGNLDQTVVSLSDVNFIATLNNGIEPATFEWYVGDVLQSGSTGNTFTYKPTTIGTYAITARAIGVTSAPITLTVKPKPMAQNMIPTVPNYNVITAYEKATSGTIIATDANNDPLTYEKKNNTSHGTVVVNADGTWTYVPSSGYSGNDSFVVNVSDGKGGDAISTVNIVVGTNPIAQNMMPTVPNYNVITEYEKAISGTVIAIDVDNDPLTCVKGNNPSHGIVLVNLDGTWTYTPSDGYSGSDSFTVNVSDGFGGSIISTVNIIVGTKTNVEQDDIHDILDKNINNENKSSDSASNDYIQNIYAVYDQTGDSSSTSNGKYTAIECDEIGIVVRKGGSLSVNKATIAKTGNSSDVKQSGLYGINAGVLAMDESSNITINDSKINTNSLGSNAVFVTGRNAVINGNNISINTIGDFSSGLKVTHAGTINANNIIINTQGQYSPAVATDNGLDTVNIKGGTLTTIGDYSPGIYSNGVTAVEDAKINATNSECAVIEGESIINLKNTAMISGKRQAVVLYRRLSDNLGSGASLFNMTNGSLMGIADTLFYTTNTHAVINLTNVDVSNSASVLFKGCADVWGEVGQNGSNVEITLTNQVISGDVICDSISTCNIKLIKNSIWSGAANTDKTAKEVSVSIDSLATWNVTGNSYVEVLTDYDSTFSNINSNRYNIYYNSSNLKNAWLHGKTITLNGGGQLIPLAG